MGDLQICDSEELGLQLYDCMYVFDFECKKCTQPFIMSESGAYINRRIRLSPSPGIWLSLEISSALAMEIHRTSFFGNLKRRTDWGVRVFSIMAMKIRRCKINGSIQAKFLQRAWYQNNHQQEGVINVDTGNMALRLSASSRSGWISLGALWQCTNVYVWSGRSISRTSGQRRWKKRRSTSSSLDFGGVTSRITCLYTRSSDIHVAYKHHT